MHYKKLILLNFIISIAYAFNAMVGGMQWDMSPSAEGKFTFTIHPIGSEFYGWSTNA